MVGKFLIHDGLDAFQHALRVGVVIFSNLSYVLWSFILINSTLFLIKHFFHQFDTVNSSTAIICSAINSSIFQ